MRTETSEQTYVHELEEHLQHALFCGAASDPEGAVLLIRGALADGDQTRAELLASETARLAADCPPDTDTDMAAAAEHASGLVGRRPADLEGAAARYSSPLAKAWATEDAGLAWAEQGGKGRAVARLREAHALYERIGSAEDMARVRARLREDGIRLRHWTPAGRPAFGWDSLTDTEQRVVELVAGGLSNREVGRQMFLSLHTVAFHLRHVFWKLGVSSRVQLARLAAEHMAGPQADFRRPD
jgi:DNA-binding CsgD family transcriptional regulator